MKTKYLYRGLALGILSVVILTILAILYVQNTPNDFNAVGSEALYAKRPAVSEQRVVVDLSSVISQCPQADFGTNGIVKNGTSTDQQDLYSRHQNCPATVAETVWVQKLMVHYHVRYFPAVIPTVVYAQQPQRPARDTKGNIIRGGQNDDGKTEGAGGGKDKPQTPPGTPPVKEPPQNEDNSCKNKNSGKDGTPSECNAGRGQEKHDK